jgi:hypothetical protein
LEIYLQKEIKYYEECGIFKDISGKCEFLPEKRDSQFSGKYEHKSAYDYSDYSEIFIEKSFYG